MVRIVLKEMFLFSALEKKCVGRLKSVTNSKHPLARLPEIPSFEDFLKNKLKMVLSPSYPKHPSSNLPLKRINKRQTNWLSYDRFRTINTLPEQKQEAGT